MSELEEFFAGGGTYAKFSEPGDVCSGVIVTEPRVVQQNDYDTGKPAFYEDGNPMMQCIVTVQTDERDPDKEDDDGKRDIYIKGQLKYAVSQALKAAGSKAPKVGGLFTVTYTHDGERTSPKKKPPKQYVATYVPPETVDRESFFGASNGQTAPPPGIDPSIWNELSPEAQAALSGLGSK